MALSKTTSYALRILIFMGSHEERSCTADYLYQHLAIPKQYLRRLLTKLSKERLIVSQVGRNGGFVLGKPPEKIFISDIIDAVEGMESLNFCILGIINCSMKPKCAMHDLWEDVRTRMISTFSTTSLHDVKSQVLIV
jgi:Rrf2 family nitric oxide-sensitive transcriptional repressor